MTDRDGYNSAHGRWRQGAVQQEYARVRRRIRLYETITRLNDAVLTQPLDHGTVEACIAELREALEQVADEHHT